MGDSKRHSRLSQVVARLDSFGHEKPNMGNRKKLGLFTSPVLAEDEKPRLETLGENASDSIPIAGDGLPEFRRTAEPTLLEIFSDLFFAANYTVFSQNQTITGQQAFKAYIGYFSLLWGTWLAVTLYDVRFTTDSLFERAARAVQLGALVGFAAVATSFNPDEQVPQTMVTISIILAISRLFLSIEYAGVLWHVRKFKRARLPIILQLILTTSAGLIYLGVSFRFRYRIGSRVFMVWYFVSAGECLLTIFLSNFSRVLSFTRTHLMKRVALLTVMLLGDGIIAIAQDVVTIVKTPDSWDGPIIAVLTAATATIYFVFLVYFDWMKRPYLPAIRQQAWTILHYPFHVSLILFMQGFTQAIVWTKAMSLFGKLNETWWSVDLSPDQIKPLAETTSAEIREVIVDTTNKFFKLYPPKHSETWASVRNAVDVIGKLPDATWVQVERFADTEDIGTVPAEFLESVIAFSNNMQAIISSMANALFESLGIDLTTESKKKLSGDENLFKTGNFQIEMTVVTLKRYRLIFVYTYIAAGSALFLLTILSIITRITPWKPWPIARTILNLLLGIGVGCVATLYYNTERTYQFLDTSWVLAPITFVWLVVEITTHIRSDWKCFFCRKRRQKEAYAPVAVPLDNMPAWADKSVTTPGEDVNIRHRSLDRESMTLDDLEQRDISVREMSYTDMEGQYVYNAYDPIQSPRRNDESHGGGGQ